MENRFSNCCFDFEVVGFHSECGRLICKGNHSPAFTIYREKPHGFHCYCLNQQQLDQYWRCIVEDCKFMCPSECGHCGICREMSCIFVELQEAYFFQPNLICRSASDRRSKSWWRTLGPVHAERAPPRDGAFPCRGPFPTSP